MFGEAGNDKLYGDAGNDYLKGGSGFDVFYAGADGATIADYDYPFLGLLKKSSRKKGLFKIKFSL